MSRTSPTECVCVWLDTASDATAPAWIVSLDTLNAAGGAETTRTLRSYEVDVEDTDDGYEIDEGSSAEAEGRAMAFVRKAAAERGMPLYRNPEDGPAELIEPAPAAAE